MNPISVTQLGKGRSAVISVDNFTNPFNVGLGANMTSAATYNIECSLDDPMDNGYTAANATWFVVSGFSGANVSTIGSLTVPCRAVTINVTSDTGNVTLQVCQAGLR